MFDKVYVEGTDRNWSWRFETRAGEETTSTDFESQDQAINDFKSKNIPAALYVNDKFYYSIIYLPEHIRRRMDKKNEDVEPELVIVQSGDDTVIDSSEKLS